MYGQLWASSLSLISFPDDFGCSLIKNMLFFSPIFQRPLSCHFSTGKWTFSMVYLTFSIFSSKKLYWKVNNPFNNMGLFECYWKSLIENIFVGNSVVKVLNSFKTCKNVFRTRTTVLTVLNEKKRGTPWFKCFILG